MSAMLASAPADALAALRRAVHGERASTPRVRRVGKRPREASGARAVQALGALGHDVSALQRHMTSRVPMCVPCDARRAPHG